jgi:hypothetical protein
MDIPGTGKAGSTDEAANVFEKKFLVRNTDYFH